eukprot:scaffold10422_cov55-Attheya_sp.AAC.5
MACPHNECIEGWHKVSPGRHGQHCQLGRVVLLFGSTAAAALGAGQFNGLLERIVGEFGGWIDGNGSTGGTAGFRQFIKGRHCLIQEFLCRWR